MKSTDIIKASANSLNIYSFTAEALERLIEAVKAEQPCPTCEALARTVMLDQTSHDTSPPAQRTWVDLTDEEIMAIGRELGAKCRLGGNPNIDFDYARAIEAKLKAKNSP